jgi:hypothetical protein
MEQHPKKESWRDAIKILLGLTFIAVLMRIFEDGVKHLEPFDYIACFLAAATLLLFGWLLYKVTDYIDNRNLK